VGVSRDCPNFLSTPSPPIISGMGKAMNFKFCTHIYVIDRNKSPLKISAKVAVGNWAYSGTLEKFLSTHIYIHASRCHLCGSSAFLFCCWYDCLELIFRRHARSRVFCGQLQTVTEDIFIYAVLVCSAH